MGFITILVYMVLSLFVGTTLIGLSVDLIALPVVFNYIEKELLVDVYSRISMCLVGMIIILVWLRYVFAIFRHSRKDKAITFESEQGKVSVTLFAIEDMLRKMLEERTEVSHVKPRVFLRKKFIEIVTRGILTSEVNLVDFTKEIQESVKGKMSSLLGEGKEVKVNLEIRKVVLKGKKGLSEEKEPEIPFRNYE